MSHAINANEVKELYQVMKQLPAANLTAAHFEWTSAELAKQGRENPFDTQDRVSAFKLMHSVAGQVSEAEFVDWVERGTQPELLKLSPAQMEKVRGGAIMLAVFAGLALGTLIVGGGILVHASMQM